MRLGIGLIGLGSIGLRMLRAAHVHERVRPAAAWDPDAAKRERARGEVPDLTIAGDAAGVIAAAAVDIVYIASPPVTHAAHARAALDAGKPVLCEKPLGVDLDESRALVVHAACSRVPNAVNFIHASGAGSRLAAEVSAGALGRLHCAELRIHARQWRERRYAEAPWLEAGDQGGMVREVMSHFVYLSQRLFGPARVAHCHLHAPGLPGSAETLAFACLDCGGVPVHMMAGTEGEGPDAFEYTVWGERASRCVFDLYRIRGSDGGPWQDLDDAGGDAGAAWLREQLDNVAGWAAGEAHTLPDFAEAFTVQQAIERMLGD